MTLPASGPISLTQIQAEFGGANPISLGEYYRNGVYVPSNNTTVPTSGAISLGNFYGASNPFTFTISTNQTNANLRTLAVNAGWNETQSVVATIGSGIYISSNNTATAALTVNGSWPGGVELVNSGLVIGMGGAGGGSDSFALGPGTPGSAGGLALLVSSAVSINNAGTIAGGGGGGGGSGSEYNQDYEDQKGYFPAGGGGGRSSAAADSAGGVAYGGGEGVGGVGTVSSGGAGGLAYPLNGGFGTRGVGGTGGNWGTVGSTGTTGLYAGGVGGAAGAAISGNSNITWIAFGTRLGGIS
jgi:hypothetical protein